MPGQRGGKAGVSWPVQELTSDPLAKFFQPGSVCARRGASDEQKLTWHYNWNKRYDHIVLPETSLNFKANAEFVPMMWSPEFLTNSIALQDGWKHLLGFNEPDHMDPSVASRASPAEAARSFVQMAALRTSPDQKLISPAVAQNKAWLREFLSLLPKDASPDYLAIHIYTTTFESFHSQVEAYWKEFGLPLWITEFAMQSFDPNVPLPQNQQQVHDFMGQTTHWMDNTDYIAYCWFGAVRDPANLHGVHHFNRLMDEQGNITPLGHQYISGGHD